MVKTKEEVIQWVQDYAGPLGSKEDLADFASKLNEQIGQMDFRAANGGAAVAYSGWLGNDNEVMSPLFLTAKELSENSQGRYSFINDGAENILNDKNFKDVLDQKIGIDEARRLMNGDASARSFGNNLSLNDFVSENYMRANARGDVLVLMGTDVTRDNVLARTELPLLINDHPDVTAINGISVEELRRMSPEQAFDAVHAASLRIQAEGTLYRGERPFPTAGSPEKTVEILDLSETAYGKGVTPPEDLTAQESMRDRITQLDPAKAESLGLSQDDGSGQESKQSQGSEPTDKGDKDKEAEDPERVKVDKRAQAELGAYGRSHPDTIEATKRDRGDRDPGGPNRGGKTPNKPDGPDKGPKGPNKPDKGPNKPDSPDGPDGP